jgi:hypothetical protein
MQDRPTVQELLEAAREAIEREIIPALADARPRYHALIVANVLRIVEREVAGGEEPLRQELTALRELLARPPETPPADPARLREDLLEANRELCARIRSGAADAGPWRERVVARVRLSVEEKLRANNPAQLRSTLDGPGRSP